jgi:hypothetical protein
VLSHVAAVRIALTGGFDGLRSGTTKERSQFYRIWLHIFGRQQLRRQALAGLRRTTSRPRMRIRLTPIYSPSSGHNTQCMRTRLGVCRAST